MKFISLFFTAAMALVPIDFIGKPIAKSTITEAGTTLVANPSGWQQSGARFPYVKLISDPGQAGLATVYLEAGGTRVGILQIGFDAISQTCSCYWLDAKDLVARFPGLLSRWDYRISMIGDKYQIYSGTFGIAV